MSTLKHYISSKFSFFQAKRTKYWKFYIIKTTELIPTNNNNNDRLTAFDPGQPG